MHIDEYLKSYYNFATRFRSAFAKATADTAGCSAVRLAHLVWDQRVAGSNPATPTKEKAFPRQREGFVFMTALKARFHKPA